MKSMSKIDIQILAEIDKSIKMLESEMDNKPKTLDEAVIALDTILTKEDKNVLIAAVDKKEAAISLHSSLGRHLRNEWELWAGSDLALHFKEIYGIIHPDDMSHKIIMTYINSLVK